MSNKSFIFTKLILTSAFLLTFFLLASGCAKPSESAPVTGNQMNINTQKPAPTPTINIDGQDQPPADLSKAPLVTYCELIKNAAKYDHRIVRMRAIYFSGFEKIYLYDERCEANQPPSAPKEVPAEMWAQQDKSFVSTGASDEAKLNRGLTGFGRKDVTVTGKFYSTNEQGDANAPNFFGHMNCCHFQFLIMRVEHLNNLDEHTSVDPNKNGTRDE